MGPGRAVIKLSQTTLLEQLDASNFTAAARMRNALTFRGSEAAADREPAGVELDQWLPGGYL